jgi:hypothetical protein
MLDNGYNPTSIIQKIKEEPGFTGIGAQNGIRATRMGKQ